MFSTQPRPSDAQCQYIRNRTDSRIPRDLDYDGFLCRHPQYLSAEKPRYPLGPSPPLLRLGHHIKRMVILTVGFLTISFFAFVSALVAHTWIQDECGSYCRAQRGIACTLAIVGTVSIPISVVYMLRGDWTYVL